MYVYKDKKKVGANKRIEKTKEEEKKERRSIHYMYIYIYMRVY